MRLSLSGSPPRRLRLAGPRLPPRLSALAALLLALALAAACARREPAPEVYISGLTQPRGLALEADGSLLVAEAGLADPARRTPPITTNQSGRVLRITPDRRIDVLADGLPYQLDTASGTDIGPADVLALGGERYLLMGEGVAPLSRMVLRLRPGSPPEPVASVLNFAMKDNLFAKMVGGAGVQANPFAMVATPDGKALLLSDGASGRVLRAGLDGQISVYAEVPKMPPLTGMAFGPDGRLYVAVFSVLPHTPGTGAVWAADGPGSIRPALEGLTMPIDVAFDAAGRLHVLEFGDGRSPKEPYAGGGGRLLRVGADGSRQVVLDHLDHPTSMLFTPAGDLLIAVGGAFSGAGQGKILRLACAELGGEGCPTR